MVISYVFSVNCNCSSFNTVGEPITFDATGFDSIKRGILMTNEKSIFIADEYGCRCFPLINMTAHGFSCKLSRSTNLFKQKYPTACKSVVLK